MDREKSSGKIKIQCYSKFCSLSKEKNSSKLLEGNQKEKPTSENSATGALGCGMKVSPGDEVYISYEVSVLFNCDMVEFLEVLK